MAPQAPKVLAASTVLSRFARTVKVTVMVVTVTGHGFESLNLAGTGCRVDRTRMDGELGSVGLARTVQFPGVCQPPVMVAGRPPRLPVAWAGSLKPVLTHAIFIIDH